MNTELDRINQRLFLDLEDFCSTDAEKAPHVGHYAIIFDGLIADSATPWLIGHVKAWGILGDPSERGASRYFVHVVGGRGSGEYFPGDYFDVRPRDGEERITPNDLLSADGYQRVLELIKDGVARVRSYAQSALDGQTVQRARSMALLPFDPDTGEVPPAEVPMTPKHHRFVSNVYADFGG